MQEGLGEWLTVSEAARRLGISRQALQYKIKKGKVDHRLDNRGNPMVHFAASPQNLAANFSGANGAGAPAKNSGSPAPEIGLDGLGMMPLSVRCEVLEATQRAHIEAIAGLRAQIAHERCEHAQEREQAVHRLAERDAMHREALERQERQYCEVVECWRERADRAEIAAEESNRMLHDLISRIMALPVPGAPPAPTQDRPWWARWFGSSKRSEIG